MIPDEAADSDDMKSAASVATRILGFVNAPSLQQKVIARCLDAKVNIEAYDKNRKALTKDLQSLVLNVLSQKERFISLSNHQQKMRIFSVIQLRSTIYLLFLVHHLAVLVL